MELTEILYNSIDSFSSHYDNYESITKSLDTPLFGEDGILDSLGLVSFLVIVEQIIADEMNINITIADEKAMSQKHSPFRTVGNLKDYLETIV